MGDKRDGHVGKLSFRTIDNQSFHAIVQSYPQICKMQIKNLRLKEVVLFALYAAKAWFLVDLVARLELLNEKLYRVKLFHVDNKIVRAF